MDIKSTCLPARLPSDRSVVLFARPTSLTFPRTNAALVQLEQQTEQASDDLEVANANVSADMDRWRTHKDQDLMVMFKDLAESQMAFYQATSDAWETAVHTIEAM